MTRRSPATRALVWAAALTLAVVGCAPPPASGPGLATGDGPGPRPADPGPTDPDTPPEWLPPRSDLDWAPCADRLAPEGPAGAQVDCALVGPTPAVRLTTADTPADAPPLVMVAGPENPPDEMASRLLAADSELTSAHPIVLVDHRGRAGPAGSCLTFEARRTLDGLADEGIDPTDPEVRADLADASQACTDQLLGEELEFASAAAAEDLEVLRQAWDVPGLALLGVGTGARTALEYAGSRPEGVSMLVLDSPAPAEGDQETAARSALAGSDAALRLWAASCAHEACGPGGPDEKVSAVSAALDEARSPDAPVPAALLADVVRSALADISGASADSPADGDTLLGELVSAEPGEISEAVRDRARQLSSTSLPYVAGCSDLSQRVPVSRVGELSSEWEEETPFGEILAAQLSVCSTWPVPPPSPVELPGAAPVLLLSGVADPVAGAAPLEPTAGALTGAGAPEVATVTWGAPGSRVILHSACARSAVVDFLAEPDAVEQSTACPS